MSDSHALHPRWPLLLKIEISSNSQICFILSQNVPKLTNINIKGNPIRMIQAKFGLNWPSGFRGEDFLKSLQTDDGRQVMAIAHTGELERLFRCHLGLFWLLTGYFG
jgi:hypothetical protein